MNLNSIIEKTNYSFATPSSTDELIECIKAYMDFVIVSLVVAEIEVTSAMFKMSAKKDLLGLLKLIPNITEQMAADVIDGSIIGLNLQEVLFDEAIDAAKDLKVDIKSKED
jgi:hypothetical protein